jgi:PAS domain S-box-containing protein
MRLWVVQTLIVNAVVLAGFLGYGAYTAWEQTERERREITNDARNLAQSIAAGSADDILTESYDRIESRLLRQVALSSIRELLIISANGRVLSHVQRLDDDSVQPIYRSRFVDPGKVAVETMSTDSYAVRLPIERGTLLGYVKVVASLDRLREVSRHIWEDTLEITLWTVLCLAILQGLLLRRIGRSLETTADFADELVHQRGKTIDQHSRITELRQLKTALNRVSVDLSRQHRNLSESEARKAAILEAWMDCLIIVDFDGRVIEFNRAAEDTFGYRRNEAVGSDMATLIIPEHMRSRHEAGMAHYRETGEGPVLGQRLEMPALRKDGTEFPTELTIVPFSAHDQHFFLGAIRDVSARKALEDERRLAEERLRSTMADLDARERALDKHAIVSVTDLQGTIIYANQKFSDVSGYSNAELVGQNHRILKSGLHDASFYRDLWTTIRDGRSWHGEFANRRKNGEIYWVTSTIVPVLDADDRPRQYIAIRTDITEQKRATEQAATARERELSLGFQIQQTLLVDRLPGRVGQASLAVYVEPSAGIDGDFYEFTKHTDQLFDLALGDVMGKGIPAALIGAGVKQQLAKATPTTQTKPMEPAEIVNRIHANLYDNLVEVASFVTFAYFRFDVATGRISYVDAGHTKAIHAGAGQTRLLEGDNLPLGVLGDERYRQHTVGWQPGDVLLLYSDGLTEAMSPGGEMFGSERLSALVTDLHGARAPASVLLQAVRKEIRRFLDGSSPNDDSTCIVVAYDATGPALTELLLPRDPSRIADLRASVEQAAEAVGLDEEAVQSLVLAVSETAANIVRHNPEALPASAFHVSVRPTANGLEVVFHYLGEPFDPVAPEPDFDGGRDNGFGLYIVRNSVDEALYEALPHGVFRITLRKSIGEPDN